MLDSLSPFIGRTGQWSAVMAMLALAVLLLAWLALCLTGMNTFWQHRAARRGAVAGPTRKP